MLPWKSSDMFLDSGTEVSSSILEMPPCKSTPLILKMIHCKGIWSSGMILASGARGLEFNSKNAPQLKPVKEAQTWTELRQTTKLFYNSFTWFYS